MSPIAWVNDDMPELGAGTSWRTILAEAAAIGFEGVELGGGFPRDATTLRTAFADEALAVIGQWYGCALLDRSAAEERDALMPQLDLLAATGASVLIVAETSNAVHRDHAAPLAKGPRLADHEWPRWGERLTELAGHVASRGLRLAYHPHLGTIVERGEDIRRLLAVTGSAVGLTLDTGHATLSGVDPVAVVRDHPERIAHVHCKDVRMPAFRSLRARDGSFLDGMLDGMFAMPGDGPVDFAALMRALSGTGYDGWLVVEAEQDPQRADPRIHAARGLAAIRAAIASGGGI